MSQQLPKLEEMFDLNGQVALITGGAAGIGRAVAKRFLEAGARVMLVDVDPAMVENAASELAAGSPAIAATVADVREPASAERAVDAAVALWGRLDVLVNNAGIFPATPTLELSEERWDWTLDLNLKGAFFFARAAAQRMVSSGRGGSIINLASINAFRPFVGLAPYSASKAGIVSLTQSLALELGRAGVRVNAIAPGGIDTPGGSQARAQIAKMYGATEDQIRDGYCARVPLGRMGQPDEVAMAALFLASPAASYVSGTTLAVDGGYLVT